MRRPVLSRLAFSLLALFAVPFVASADPRPAATCDLDALKWVGIPFDRRDRLRSECRPQILYSWLSSPDILDAKDSKWPFRRGVAFMYRSPLGTAMYGNFSYRVKLKPGVDFKLEPWDDAHANCLHPEAEKKHTVYVNHTVKTGFSEYVICSDEVVESWSFGMPEHLDEMLAERELILRRGAENVDGFLNPNSGDARYVCPSCFQGYTIHDARNDGSLETVDASIALMRSWVENGRGRVYRPTDRKAYASGPVVDAHFQTSLALPFHRASWPAIPYRAGGSAHPAPAPVRPAPVPARRFVIRTEKAFEGVRPVQKAVSSFCDGKSECEYMIARKFLAAPDTVTAFTVTWRCCDAATGACGPKPNGLEFWSIDLEGSKFVFGCSPAGAMVHRPLLGTEGKPLRF